MQQAVARAVHRHQGRKLLFTDMDENCIDYSLHLNDSSDGFNAITVLSIQMLKMTLPIYLDTTDVILTARSYDWLSTHSASGRGIIVCSR